MPTTDPGPSPADLRARIGALGRVDERRLGRRLHDLGRQRDPERAATDRSKLITAIETAEARIAARAASVGTVRYPDGLPIVARKDEIAAAIRDHQVVVIAGETGSGKSTQLPKICLELGRGVKGLIGHTQPRRLAARTIASRIAEELGVELGSTVGFSVRFTDTVSDQTLVKVMTDGILLAETRSDRDFDRYDTLIIDEAHERSLNIDFLLGYLTQLLPRRPDLKVIITSATIDTERFSQHFGGAPIIEVTGRTYPVDVRYRPYGTEPDDERDQTQAIVEAVDELCLEGPGDILVFLSGEREIHDVADSLRRGEHKARPGGAIDVLPLYARLALADQQRIFQPHPGRRVVLATNVAETSLTVPGIRYVVDAGTARISRYSNRLKVQRLPIERISQASANQRAGRCGRVAPGVCIRLYAEDDFASRGEFTEPEILRTNLASVVLQMAYLGMGDIASFPFVEPPDSRAIKDGIALLEELGAFDPDATEMHQRLTPVGRRLARLPIDPRLGRMVLEAEKHHCVREVLVIAAVLSIQDPRERPADKQQAADESHRRFADERSDFLSFLKLWEHLRERQRELSGNQFRRLCKAEFFNYLRVREWEDLTSQLRQVAADLGLRSNSAPADADSIHQSLLVGLLSQIGMRDGLSREFKGARNARFMVGHGSVLAKKPPKWVMVGELVETNRLWGRVAATIQPEWAEQAGAHLVHRTYSEPRWDRGRGSVLAIERVTLYGLPIIAGRSVQYGRIDPVEARALFIQHALVEGDWDTHHPFFHRNNDLVEHVQSFEDRARRRDLLVDDHVVFAFYDARLGPEVSSSRHFDRWWRDAKAKDPKLLDMTMELLVNPTIGSITDDAFPDTWVHDDTPLPVTYEFDPTSPTDGITLDVPLLALGGLRSEAFTWLVPGHREELVEALLRSLPKTIRRDLQPVADHVRLFLTQNGPADGPLLDVLARYVGRVVGQRITAADFDLAKVPSHLRVTFAVVDDDGERIAIGKSIDALHDLLADRIRATVAAGAGGIEASGLTAWTIGTLPRTVSVTQGGRRVEGYPALVDEGDAVGVRIFTDPDDRDQAMLAGTRRLLTLVVASPTKTVERQLTNDTKLAIARSGLGSLATVLDDCIAAAVAHLLDAHGGPVWDEQSFSTLAASVRAELPAIATAIARSAGRILTELRAVEQRLDKTIAPVLQPSVADIRAQLQRLIHPGFISRTPPDRLVDLVRYLQAVERRLDKLGADPVRDAERGRRIRGLEHRIDEIIARWPIGQVPAEVAALRWLTEELRVGTFAQVLGTKHPVSEQRIERAIADALAPYAASR